MNSVMSAANIDVVVVVVVVSDEVSNGVDWRR